MEVPFGTAPLPRGRFRGWTGTSAMSSVLKRRGITVPLASTVHCAETVCPWALRCS